MGSTMLELEDQYGDRVNFVYLDIDNPQARALKSALDYRYPPQTVVLAPDGQGLRTFYELVSRETLERAILDALN